MFSLKGKKYGVLTLCPFLYQIKKIFLMDPPRNSEWREMPKRPPPAPPLPPPPPYPRRSLDDGPLPPWASSTYNKNRWDIPLKSIYTLQVKSWNSSLLLTDNHQSCIHLDPELHLRHLEHYQTSKPTNYQIAKEKITTHTELSIRSTKESKDKYLNKAITWRTGRNLQFNIHYTAIL